MQNELMVLQPMDGELGDLERAGIHEAQVLQTIENQRKAEQDRKEAEEAEANWHGLIRAIQADLPDYLYQRRSWDRDKEFTEDTMTWEVEIPLPNHRASLVARYNLVYDPKVWKRVPLQGGAFWGVCRWVVNREPLESEIVLSHKHLGYANELKKALYLAYREGLRYHKLAGDLEEEQKKRREEQSAMFDTEPQISAGSFQPTNDACCCTLEERQLLDSLYDCLGGQRFSLAE